MRGLPAARTAGRRGAYRLGVICDDDPDADWTAPGVFRCAPGVHRIPLPLPNDGLRAVNVYAVADGDGWTLIDSGWALAQAGDLLQEALAQLGAGLGDVRRFLVTHVHRDHYTQAVVLRRQFGIRVALGRGEQPALEVINGPRTEPAHLTRLRHAGGHELLARLAKLPSEPHDPTVWEYPDDWIDDGAEIVLDPAPDGKRVLQAVATPGHTQGHLVFADQAGELLFSGDHVLPRITPSIGFEAAPARRPLADFLTSLELVRARPDAALLPAHGPVGRRVHERVDKLIAHHAKRLDATLGALQDGRSTAYEVAAALPWTRRDRRLEELDPFNAMLATLETAAHLDVLVERGVVRSVETDGVNHYTT
ncbi:MBL fold metallo-hydrolase [Pseudonocardia xinjiangensis]|uniref:MBL fold metallo-hydrolase n=1 Tax=Pseudonocardia xinjiangensis TaxID=75289 RepID=A0ABX1R9L4_9PSEU|nr:MBL fold metallo-hydrolase [Pseudonocardia xinjiangensis]